MRAAFVSEILRGRRELTLPMIRGLHRELQIPYDVLLVTEDDNYARVAVNSSAGKAAGPRQRGKAASATKRHARAS